MKPRPDPLNSPAAFAIKRFMLTLLPLDDDRNLHFWRLARLALFQVSCGMSAVLLTGTLNRVMIVEAGMPGWIVALMVSLPLLIAPFRALIGFRSDTHRSAFGWRRLPYVWFGSLLQFGGIGIMPFALLVMSGSGVGHVGWGYAGAALAFLMIGAGMHTVQTAGLALATDLASDTNRHRVVAFHYVMLLVGMMISAVVISLLLVDFTAMRLIQVLQGAAVFGIALNVIAMWGQESRRGNTLEREEPNSFGEAWRGFLSGGPARRLLVAVGLGGAGFGMQDVLLEPYGGQVLGLGVGATTLLTALWALGTLIGFLLAARALGNGAEPYRISGFGAASGILAFALVILSAPLQSTALFQMGALGIGFGGGVFAVGTLTAAMAMAQDGFSGLAIGAWGAAQATASGLGIAGAGLLRDGVTTAAMAGAFGEPAASPAVGYIVVYLIEVLLLFATLAAIGPLARYNRDTANPNPSASKPSFGLTQFPT